MQFRVLGGQGLGLFSGMRLTPLPGCILVEVCDLQVLFECPIDSSALPLFLPTLLPCGGSVGEKPNAQNKKQKINSSPELLPFPFKEVNSRVFIDAEPWYRFPLSGLLDLALLDAIVVSNPFSMLGLPYLTREPEFSGKVFATDVTATMGALLLRELLTCHSEFVSLFGRPAASESFPRWTSEDLISSLPTEFKKIVTSSCWRQLYSEEDVASCLKKIHRLNYGEEASVDDSVTFVPSSSGFCIGAANWVLKGPCTSLAYISHSSVKTNHAAAFEFRPLEGPQVLVLPDFHVKDDEQQEVHQSTFRSQTRAWATAPVKFITPQNRTQVLEDLLPPAADCDKEGPLQKVMKSITDVVSKGGSVLFPTNISDILLEVIETMAVQLRSANLGHVPIFFVSPCAEEFLAFSNIVPEWLSPSRQEKLYAGEPSFAHVELLKGKRLRHLSSLSSAAALSVWQEPCVVFAAHSSLRMGPAVHLLHRWRQRADCLLLLSQSEYDTELALCPFRPLSMQVLNFPLDAGLRLADVGPLIQRLRPTIAAVPETLRSGVKCGPETRPLFFSQLPLEVDELEQELSVEISSQLASSIKLKQVKSGNAAEASATAVARVCGELHFHDAKFYLDQPSLAAGGAAAAAAAAPPREVMKLGTVEAEELIKVLKDKGLDDARIEEPCASSSTSSHPQKLAALISLRRPSSGVIELGTRETCIKANDPVLRRLIADAISSLLQPL